MKKTKFLKEKRCQDYDLVHFYSNLDPNADLKEIRNHHELSPFNNDNDMVHSERTITLELKSNKTFYRVDNTFHKSTYVAYTADGKFNRQDVPSGSSQEQCKQIFAFFKTAGFSTHTPGLNLLCTSNNEDVEIRLIDDGHEIITSESNIHR